MQVYSVLKAVTRLISVFAACILQETVFLLFNRKANKRLLSPVTWNTEGVN